MEPIRLGIVGCGVISGSHLELAAKCPLATVVAVADLIEERARARAASFGIAKYYLNDEDLLNDARVEAVVLAMPTGVRTPVAYKALRRGKHVLLEKPVASKASEVKRMLALRGDRVVACCSSRMSFTGHAAAAAQCVASGALGQIRLARIRAVHPAPAQPAAEPPPWRQSMALNGGGILVNWSCYDLDYLMQITAWQLQPRAVLAQWWPVAPPMRAYVAPGADADSHYVACIRCAAGQVLSMERAEFSTGTTDQAWEVVGTEGSLYLPMQPPPGKPNAVILNRFVPGRGVVAETVWTEGQSNPDDNVVNDFVRAIREGRRPRTDLERALVMQKITDAIYASAQSGRCRSVRPEKE
jgi:predicted dehydrogenase